MVKERNDSEKMVLPLAAGLSFCMMYLLLLIGFKLRWFRARLTMGPPPDQEQQQPTLMAGTYRRTFDSDNVPIMLQNARTHKSMPDLTSKGRKQTGLTDVPQTKTARRRITELLKLPLRRHTKSKIAVETNDAPQINSLNSIKMNSSPSPATNRNPMSARSGKEEHLLFQKPKLATPLSSRSSSPITFGEAPLNHRADRLESLYLAPEVGVPFAKGNPLPSWANKAQASKLSGSDSQLSQLSTTETPIEIKVSSPTSSIHSVKIPNSSSPAAKNRKTVSINEPSQDEHNLNPKSMVATPLSSRSASPVMFGEAPLNHRADRLESLCIAPEIGVPFARGNPLPTWVYKGTPNSRDLSESDSEYSDTKSVEKYNAEATDKTMKYPRNERKIEAAFHDYEEFDI